MPGTLGWALPTIPYRLAARGLNDDQGLLTPYFQIAVANGLTEVNAISPYHETLQSFFKPQFGVETVVLVGIQKTGRQPTNEFIRND